MTERSIDGLNALHFYEAFKINIQFVQNMYIMLCIVSGIVQTKYLLSVTVKFCHMVW